MSTHTPGSEDLIDTYFEDYSRVKRERDTLTAQNAAMLEALKACVDALLNGHGRVHAIDKARALLAQIEKGA